MFMGKGLSYLIITSLIWAWPTIFIKILGNDFDAITQSFFRYAAASVVLFGWTYLFIRKEFMKAIVDFKQFILPAILVVLYQILFVIGIYFTSAIVSNLLTKSSVVFTMLFSFLLFHDEKIIMKSKQFIIGTLLAIIGVSGVIIGRNGLTIDSFNTGVFLLILAALSWGMYTISIKKLVNKIEPFVVTTFVIFFATLLFFPLVIFFGDIGKVFEVSSFTNLLLFGSGILCVGIGNMFYYKDINYLGTARTSSFVLITPLITGIISFFILGEILTLVQILFGVVLIAGCFLLIKEGDYGYHRGNY